MEKYFSHDQDNRSPRWIGTITNNMLKISNCDIILDCSQYYGNKNIIDNISINENDNNDYAIQNKLAEIKVRQKQSKFRKMVLKNFNDKCCISGIKEIDLLRASHIVPWSENIESRLDPSNGLCLFVLYDVLFDQGYFSLSDNCRVIVPNSISSYSIEMQNILLSIKDKEILKPVKYEIKLEYVKYHRENIFIQKDGT
jgi:predicted restriction endonuclease